MKHHTFTIDNQRTIVTNTNLTETNFTATYIDSLATTILQRQYQIVKVGCLCTPQTWSRHIHIETEF